MGHIFLSHTTDECPTQWYSYNRTSYIEVRYIMYMSSLYLAMAEIP